MQTYTRTGVGTAIALAVGIVGTIAALVQLNLRPHDLMNGATSLASPLQQSGPYSGTGYYLSTTGCPGAPTTGIPNGATSFTLVALWGSLPPAQPADTLQYVMSGYEGPGRIASSQAEVEEIITKTVGATYDCKVIPLDVPFSRDGNTYYDYAAYSGVYTDTVPATYVDVTSVSHAFPVGGMSTYPAFYLASDPDSRVPMTTFTAAETVYLINRPTCAYHRMQMTVSAGVSVIWSLTQECVNRSGAAWDVTVPLSPGTYTAAATYADGTALKDATTGSTISPVTFTVVP